MLCFGALVRYQGWSQNNGALKKEHLKEYGEMLCVQKVKTLLSLEIAHVWT